MRVTFIRTLQELAARDERIVLLTGDLGFHVIEPFAEAFPDRFYNVGVAEQHMAGLAVGLAEAGYLPFIYSIAPFVTLRPYEFLRNGAIHQNLPVRIVAVGAGYAYGELGPSHHLLEDIAVFRPHTNLAMFSPVDAPHTEAMLRQTYDRPGPVYYRLGKNEALRCERLGATENIDELATLRRGGHAVAFTLGEISCEMLSAAEQLATQGIELEIRAISSINPLPRDAIIRALSAHSFCFTCEEHYAAGGIGSLIAEVIAEEGLACRLHRLHATLDTDGLFGSQSYMRDKQGLSAARMAQTIMTHLKEANA